MIYFTNRAMAPAAEMDINSRWNGEIFMKCFILAAALVTATGAAAFAQGLEAAPADTVKTCESCHGVGGNSTTSSTPRLNGQLSAYILNRLRELTDLTRESPHAAMAMHDIAQMKDLLRSELAAYFVRQAPTPAQPQSGKLAAIGARLFANGDSANHIDACQSCHGPNAEGHGNAPRLAGQHRSYLKTQDTALGFQFRHARKYCNAS